jgi:hypothetical protein
MCRLTLLVSGLVLALGVTAGAEHEVYYRFVVLGYLKDTHGQPVIGQMVELTRNKTGLAYRTQTDAHGLYLLVARLGDESAGETLTLRAGPASARIVARFDPTNHADDRGTRLDLEGSRFVERAASFRPTLARVLETLPR